MRNKKIIFIITFLVSLVFLADNSWAVTCQSGFTAESGVCIPNSTGLPDPGTTDPVATVIINIMEWLLRVVGVIAIIAFVIAGLQYLLSAGDQNTMELGKRNMKWSIVGVVVALIGLIILNFVFEMLS